MKLIALEGYRVDLCEYEGVWIATAKRDRDNQFHAAKRL